MVEAQDQMCLKCMSRENPICVMRNLSRWRCKAKCARCMSRKNLNCVIRNPPPRRCKGKCARGV
ncbi:hypothetical protein BHE74_00025443 [Ensete ventricosum]|uniref:Uncharacterized protein n=1 Tax=Ensete ventricosum TaxID=4639 RepID=A0A444EDF5_ENSVE|nr:hypothetical protein B296_00032036 [Ensete ventricosum]RWW08429.1 hypothetical protein GW17_00028136 [Ensete ventricosum]RWW67131.1 hypothetical protein BHE74_00025443 [Ensete ventricosum]RZS07214.1 hypothetical protein BHM03_00038012 [Ensete ventricosum]